MGIVCKETNPTCGLYGERFLGTLVFSGQKDRELGNWACIKSGEPINPQGSAHTLVGHYFYMMTCINK